MNLRIIYTLLIASSLLAGCNNKTDDKTPSKIAYRDTACSDMLGEAPFPPSATCGYLTVPEKHATDSQPASDKTFEIAVVKLATASSNKQPDPIVYLQGGPGFSAISFIGLFTQGPGKVLLSDRDVYLVDPRGTGHSKPAFLCTEYQGPAGTPAQIEACKQRLTLKGVDFTAYQSVQSAHDIISLRKALNIDRWNLYGVSFGTRLATTIMREESSGIRSVILDGVFPIEVNGISDTPWSVYAILDRIVENCKATTDCDPADIKTKIESVIARLQNQSRESDAAAFIKHLQDNVGDKEVLTIIESYNINLEYQKVKDEKGPRKMPPQFYAPMALSIVCSEEYPFLNQTALIDSNNQNWSETTRITVDKTYHMGFDASSCKAWNVKAADSIETQAVTSSLPTLILSGGNDDQTPPAWGDLVANNLPNSQTATNPQTGHAQLFSGNTHRKCIDKILLEFLNLPTESVEKTCADNIPAFSYN